MPVLGGAGWQRRWVASTGLTGLRFVKTSLICAAALAGILFIFLYAVATPLTDDWLLLQNAMLVQQANIKDIAGLQVVDYTLRWKLGEHPLLVPMAFYLPLGMLTS